MPESSHSALSNSKRSWRASGRQLVYGWEFLDVPPEKGFDLWADRISVDQRWEPDGMTHTLDLFQEGSGHLDLRIWFDDLRISDPQGNEISFAEFTAGGRRWWDALHAGDPRAGGHGIVPLKGDQALP